MIPYGRQDISDADIAAVVAVLQSDWLTQGPMIETFEQQIASLTQANHAVAVANATAGLHIACLAAGLGAGDWLWTSPNSFLASANCGLYCGAQVDFVDIDPFTWNMDVGQLEAKLIVAAKRGALPKIVVPVAFSGQSCDMARIRQLADQYGFLVIEDASHAIGASYAGLPVGCGKYADMTVFSFHPVKIITTGEGGMVVTNNADLNAGLRLFRSHGMTRDPSQMGGESHGPWYYEQIALGFNYRMTDLQAALGVSQIKRLDTFLARRRELADRYDQLLADVDIQLPTRQHAAISSWHLYVVRIAKHRDAVFSAMRAAGVGVNVHYIPIHLQPYYQRMGFKAGDFPRAEQYYREAITLPLFAAMTDADQNQVVAALKQCLSQQ